MENNTNLDSTPVPDLHGATAPAPLPQLTPTPTPTPTPAPVFVPPPKEPKGPAEEGKPTVVSEYTFNVLRTEHNLLVEKFFQQQYQIASLQASVEQLTKSLADVASGRHRSKVNV